MKIKPKNFPYNTKAVSKSAFESHLELYHNYVDKCNEIYDELETFSGCKDANKNYSRYRGIKKGETFNLNAVILHELYFRNMTRAPSSPQEHFRAICRRYFGSYDAWAKDFIACAKSARGWAVLCYEQRTDSLRNIAVDSHDEGVVLSAYPILVLDCWEHAYTEDYGTNSEAYIENFMDSINWQIVEERIVVING